jgi:hypothetical protein
MESDVREERVHRSRTKRGAFIVAIGLALLAVASGVVWREIEGPRLTTAANGYGLPVTPGQDASFGIIATKDGAGSLRLESVSADVSAGATVTWSVYQPRKGYGGFGARTGPLAPRWPTVPVAGYSHVSTGASEVSGVTWIIGTVHADIPGVYRVSNVRITYHSGWHNRTVAAPGSTTCVLVYPSSAGLKAFLASTDPLVAQYNDCPLH